MTASSGGQCPGPAPAHHKCHRKDHQRRHDRADHPLIRFEHPCLLSVETTTSVIGIDSCAFFSFPSFEEIHPFLALFLAKYTRQKRRRREQIEATWQSVCITTLP